jgi:hypothetical protein
LGCNCKNKNKQERIVPQGIQPIQVQTQIETTLEEVFIIENMVMDINSNPEKRAYVTEFFMRNYGDPLINYCDLICMKRLKQKIEELKIQLTQKS